jgi:hypothetical protein
MIPTNPMILATDDITGTIAIGGGLLVAIVAIVTNGIRRTYQTKDREQSRREIAAYVAEGSITAEEGERLIKAGRSASVESSET